MTLKEYIKELMEYEEEWGDLEVISAEGHEGDTFNPLNITPTICYYYIGDYHGQIIPKDQYELSPDDWLPIGRPVWNAICIN